MGDAQQERSKRKEVTIVRTDVYIGGVEKGGCDDIEQRYLETDIDSRTKGEIWRKCHFSRYVLSGQCLCSNDGEERVQMGKWQMKACLWLRSRDDSK